MRLTHIDIDIDWLILDRKIRVHAAVHYVDKKLEGARLIQ